MPEVVDRGRAQQVVDEAARLAEDTSALNEPQISTWVERVHTFSSLCQMHGQRTHIAVLGTMMLAKAVNARVDVFSIRPDAGVPGAFSARSVAETSLVPASQRHQFDLGTQGLQPLNNQPFFRCFRIEQGMPVLDSKRPALMALIALLQELAQASSAEALRALAGFIHVRRRYFALPSPIDAATIKAPHRRSSSCFLSYARADSDFAAYLHDNLRRRGITCWQDIHDMRAGDFWRKQIYDAIDKHDRLILICSRASLLRPAVVEEVQEAIARERQTGAQKLFPIRLDDFILSQELEMTSRTKVTTGEWAEHWVSRVRAYHIPDFSNWSNPEIFQTEFRKLVAALNRAA